MGNLMRRAGREVVLSRSVIEHYIGNDGFVKNWKHRLRWARSTRRSRPWGYLGEIFTKPVALGLLLAVAAPKLWPVLILATLLRIALVRLTAVQILKAKIRWALLPIEDLATFLTWLLGLFGKRILWRGRWLTVARDGSFEA